jgi:hypothetical protein
MINSHQNSHSLKVITSIGLDEEVRTFKTRKAGLLTQHHGEVALVKGAEVIGIFPDEELAYKERLKRLGNVPFLIQHIIEDSSIEAMPPVTTGLLYEALLADRYRSFTAGITFSAKLRRYFADCSQLIPARFAIK